MARAGGEDQVIAELGEDAAIIGEGVVMLERRPRDAHGDPITPIFARQAMRTSGDALSIDVEEIAKALAAAISAAMRENRRWPWAVQVVAPDGSDRGVRRKIAAKIDEALGAAIDPLLPRWIIDAYVEDVAEAERLAQVWVINDEQTLVGFTAVQDAIVRTPGGKILDARDQAAPAPSAHKLREAFEWIGVAPGKGEVVIDLGAAPGAWARVAADEGAKVIAVDRGRLKIEMPPKRVEHVRASPFDYSPEETADWLLVHLAWRPLEVASLVAKWGRRVWARQVIANFLLPMKQKVEVVQRIRGILEDAGWRGIKARQLFSDGDEITIFAWLDPKQAMRGPKPAFRPRAKSSGESTAARSEAVAPRGPRRARPRRRR